MQHPYLDTLAAALTVLAAAAAIWLLVDAVRRAGKHLEDRRQRRLDRAAKREIRKQFNHIINGLNDGIEKP